MFFIKRRNILIISVLIITAITFIFCVGALKGSASSTNNVKGVKIVLDAGHGGVDGGVSGVNSKVKESELNLKIVKKLENFLIGAGFQVVLTRSSGAGLYGTATSSLKKKDMQKRKEIIEATNPALVVSVHLNQYCLSSRRGAQVFYREDSEFSKILANSIQSSFNQMATATRECSALTGDYYILNCTDYPSVIAECGFLSNPEEEALLITDEYQTDIAYAIFKGIVDYLAVQSNQI